MILGELAHRHMNHTHLRRISVCDHNIIAELNNIRYGFRSFSRRCLLLGQGPSECLVTECNDYSLLLFHDPRLLILKQRICR